MLGVLGCSRNAPPKSGTAARVIIDAERAFAADVVARGLRAGFLAHLAADGVLFHPGPVNGREYYQRAAASDARLTWEPARAGIAGAGDLGYSVGPWRLESPPETTPLYGTYATVWGRVDDRWRVAVDLGVIGPSWWPGADGPELQPPARAGEAKVGAAETARLLRRDADFGDAASPAGLAARYATRADSDIWLVRPGRTPVRGLAASRAAVESITHASGTPVGGRASGSGDLGYSYGEYRLTARDGTGERGYYLRIWRRAPGDDWRIILDMLSPIPR